MNLLGFTPMEAILAATKLGGEIMMRGTSWGKSSLDTSPICC